jgi:hypothetical protein
VAEPQLRKVFRYTRSTQRFRPKSTESIKSDFLAGGVQSPKNVPTIEWFPVFRREQIPVSTGPMLTQQLG